MAITGGSPIISVNVKGDRELQSAITKVREIGKKLETIHRLMALEAEAWIKQNFQQEGKLAKPGGWAKLSPNTIVQRRKKGGGAKILQDKGLLRGSVNSTSSSRDARAGFGDKKAVWHQAGTPPYKIRPKRKRLLRFLTASGWVSKKEVSHPGLISRPLIPSKAQILPLVIKRLDLYVAAELRKAGLKVRTT